MSEIKKESIVYSPEEYLQNTEIVDSGTESLEETNNGTEVVESTQAGSETLVSDPADNDTLLSIANDSCIYNNYICYGMFPRLAEKYIERGVIYGCCC